MKISTNNLIGELVSQLKPIDVVRFKFVDLLKVILTGCLCIFSAVAILGLRLDFHEQVLNINFIIGTFLLLLLAVLSIIAAFSLSIPSIKHQKIYRIPIFVFTLILIFTGYSFLTTSNSLLYLGHGFSCVFEMISIAVLPATFLFYFIRRAATLRRDILGFLVLSSGVAFGLLGVQFICVDSTPMHLLLWHILPSALVMVFGIWISRQVIEKI